MRKTRLLTHALVLSILAGGLASVLAPVLGSVPAARAQAGLEDAVDEVLGAEEEAKAVEGGAEGEGEGEAKEGFLPENPPDPVLTKDLLDPGAWAGLGEKMFDRLVDWLPSLFAALVVLLLFWILQRVLDGVLRRLMGRTRADPAAQEISARLMRYVVLGFGVVTAAHQLGFNVASLLAGLGILGLALGLAAQDSLANLVAGLTILWDRPFRIGDNVTVSGTFGKVQEIGLRTTRIRTVNQLDAILPNKEIINQKIVNHTLNPMMRLDIPLGIAYKEDSRKAREVLLAAVAGHELLLEKPQPEVVVVALADSSVNLELRVWLRDPYKERQATVEMVEMAKIALDEAGIEIPFPQRTLHLPSGVRLVRADEERGESDEG